MLNNRTCILCWSPGTMEIRLDRRGRPYAFCRSCMGRMFFHDARALSGLAFLPEQIDALLEHARRDPELQARCDAAVLELRAQLQSVLMPAASTPAPARKLETYAKVEEL